MAEVLCKSGSKTILALHSKDTNGTPAQEQEQANKESITEGATDAKDDKFSYRFKGRHDHGPLNPVKVKQLQFRLRFNMIISVFSSLHSNSL